MKYDQCFEAVRQKSPLVFCLTNFVTVNDCANIILASGASPVMSLDPREAADFARIAGAVLINIGTPSERSVEAMMLAGCAANDANVPVVLDPVGAGATSLRRSVVSELMKKIRFTAIRGNASEIACLAGSAFSGRGVDASSESELQEVESAVRTLARSTSSVVCASGPVDVISDGKRSLHCMNGRPVMTRITGSGCMSGALAAACIGAVPDHPFDALVSSVLAMGISGEIAESHLAEGEGTGSFRTRLLDAVSLLSGKQMKDLARYEEKFS